LKGWPRQPHFALAALALLWVVGLYARGYWTPDEPREAALAASVSAQAHPLPSLGGQPFAEKPPLTYWLAGASMRVLGASPAAARTPQLAYALLAFGAMLALLRTLLGAPAGAAARESALAGALVFATTLLVYQVQIWLDTDALLLAGVALALAGMYAALAVAGEDARARAARWRGYLAMHAGLTLAFFAKNFAAWLVPVLAFLGFIAWERRWRELWRVQFWLPALLPAACIAWWVSAVAAEPDGARSLRILFWNNLAGRLLPVAADAQHDYASGHRNSPGSYFLELPLYLLPWTAFGAYALKSAWQGVRAAGPRRAAWRFALCAAFPGLLVLSFAATARSIYAAPCMIGFVLLIALSIEDLAPEGTTARRLRNGTAVLVLLAALLVLGASAALQWTVLRAPWPLYLASSCTAAVVAAWCSILCLAPREGVAGATAASQPSLTARVRQFALAWSLLFSIGVLCLWGAMNRAQDLQSLARRVASSAGTDPLLLWRPDETTLAWAQLYLPPASWRALDEAGTAATAGLAQQLRDAPANAVIASLAPGSWSRRQWLAYLRDDERPARPAAAAAAATVATPAADEPLLSDAGYVVRTQVARPGGRGYFLWRRAAGAARISGAVQ
jgi:4-amino-4-deoxy-L-arabinose transferase-like glycosyltransferase